MTTDQGRRKYELLANDTRMVSESCLSRIRALVAIPLHGVKPGDLGGYIQNEQNLSHTGMAWVADQAQVLEQARVFEDALLRDHAQARGQALVRSEVLVDGGASVQGQAYVCSSARITGNARVAGQAFVRGQAHIGGNTVISGQAFLRGKAWLTTSNHFFAATPVGPANETLTVYRAQDDQIAFTLGSKYGLVEELPSVASDARTEREYRLLIDVATSKIMGTRHD